MQIHLQTSARAKVHTLGRGHMPDYRADLSTSRLAYWWICPLFLSVHSWEFFKINCKCSIVTIWHLNKYGNTVNWLYASCAHALKVICTNGKKHSGLPYCWWNYLNQHLLKSCFCFPPPFLSITCLIIIQTTLHIFFYNAMFFTRGKCSFIPQWKPHKDQQWWQCRVKPWG